MVFDFYNYLTSVKRCSPHTITAYKTDIEQFLFFLQSEGHQEGIVAVDRILIRAWLSSLHKQKLEAKTITRKIASLRSLFRYLVAQGHMPKSPLSGIIAPKTPKRNPSYVQKGNIIPALQALNENKNEENSSQSFQEMRSLVILEILYATGIRLSELINLKWTDINWHQNTIVVTGKGNKQRIIPLHSAIPPLLKQYQQVVHNTFFQTHTDHIILTDKGLQAYPMLIQRIVKEALMTMGGTQKFSPHILRHTFATHLLNEGASLGSIKELLGHTSLQATQVYTHNSYQKLKDTYAKAHPRSGSQE
jgi:integrase/recombinase XerC